MNGSCLVMTSEFLYTYCFEGCNDLKNDRQFVFFAVSKCDGTRIKNGAEKQKAETGGDELAPCRDLTCPAASVSPHRALDATPTLSPKATTSPVLQC